jgi:DNA invertase Pin-like site-specific DNA recombinase
MEDRAMIKAADNPWLTATTDGCQTESVEHDARTREEVFGRIKQVRAQAIEHTRQARTLAAERRDLMRVLIQDGLSQADIARELGVTRQAIQKMLDC